LEEYAGILKETAVLFIREGKIQSAEFLCN